MNFDWKLLPIDNKFFSKFLAEILPLCPEDLITKPSAYFLLHTVNYWLAGIEDYFDNTCRFVQKLCNEKI